MLTVRSSELSQEVGNYLRLATSAIVSRFLPLNLEFLQVAGTIRVASVVVETVFFERYFYLPATERGEDYDSANCSGRRVQKTAT